MKKRGQITIFLIAAVIIIATGSVAYYVSEKSSDVSRKFFSNEFMPEYNNIKSLIINCLEYSAEDSIEVIGIQGGYYQKQDPALEMNFTFVPYYYYEGKDFTPSISKIENQLSKYVDDSLQKCINNIKRDNIEITSSKPRTKVSIDEDEISFITDVNIFIKKDKENIKVNLKDNEVIKKSALNRMLIVSKYIVNSFKNNSEIICTDCLADFAKSNKVSIDLMNFQTNTLVVISENQTTGKAYAFEFVNKFKEIK